VAQLLLLHLLAAVVAPWLAKVLRTKAFPVLAVTETDNGSWEVRVRFEVRG
jgi:multicomponent Na+:H+ antiporter subunit A